MTDLRERVAKAIWERHNQHGNWNAFLSWAHGSKDQSPAGSIGRHSRAELFAEAGLSYQALLADADTAIAVLSEWQPIENAPKDRPILVYVPRNTPRYQGPSAFMSVCRWHPDAGFRVGSHLQDPTNWMDLPPPPRSAP